MQGTIEILWFGIAGAGPPLRSEDGDVIPQYYVRNEGKSKRSAIQGPREGIVGQQLTISSRGPIFIRVQFIAVPQDCIRVSIDRRAGTTAPRPGQ